MHTINDCGQEELLVGENDTAWSHCAWRYYYTNDTESDFVRGFLRQIRIKSGRKAYASELLSGEKP